MTRWCIYLLRYVGRVLIALCHVLSATCVYFIYTYRTMMDATMLVLPAIYVLVQKISYGTLKRLGVAVAGSLTATIALILMNLNQVLWIGKYDTELGGLIMPYSYLVNTVRIYDKKRSANKEEIKLPDASFKNEEKEAVVLVIGE